MVLNPYGSRAILVRADEVQGRTMGRTLKEIMAKLPAKRRRRIKSHAAQLLLEQLSMRDLRKALQQTQAGVARALGVRQDTVSRYERQSDLLLSTLRQYVKAMGGELSLVAEFPNRPPVKISTLGELADR
jgi:DNA-binding XRE family transcriptional regulator